jgi:S-DNA-T family DNA segregation ATPase FtsK/SpoIIIE
MAAKSKAEPRGRGREVAGILLLGLGVFALISMVSMHFEAARMMGPGGAATARALYGIAGFASYVVVAAVLAIAVRCFSECSLLGKLTENLGLAGAVAALAVLLHLPFADRATELAGPGGVVGQWLGEILASFVGTGGAALAAVTLLCVSLTLVTHLRLSRAGGVLKTGVMKTGGLLLEGLRALGRLVVEMFPTRDHAASLEAHDAGEDPADDDEEGAADDARRPSIHTKARTKADTMAFARTLMAYPVSQGPDEHPAHDDGLAADPSPSDIDGDVPPPVERLRARGHRVRMDDDTREAVKALVAEVAAADGALETRDLEHDDHAEVEAERPLISIPLQLPVNAIASGAIEDAEDVDAPGVTDDAPGPVLVEPAQTPIKREANPGFIKLYDGDFKLPPIDLFQYEPPKAEVLDKNAYYEMAERLEQAMSNYGVKGKVKQIRMGPVVTMYEFAPAPGTRTGKIARLEDDLAMALEAQAVRIVAPIPGKAVVGVEVPNKKREMVYMREILEDEGFAKSSHKLQVVLGKDISGAPVSVNLSKMPHLLVAGTTGSGKSVSVNAMIASILYNASPEDVRFIMVDPKMLELSIYEGIPHLLLPVVTDPTKANLALRWAVEEMERRYELLAKSGVRDVATYNAKLQAKQQDFDDRKAALEAEADEAGEDVQVMGDGAEPDAVEPPQRLPYIVIVIDEFADLMMVAPKDVETSVARLAQKARAAGLHLILATQRPSVDVITGIIKANLPSRIALQVASRIDARTILDQSGAETLLGNGDMLFSDHGRLRRIHGAFLSDDEVHKVVDFLKTQAKPVYDMDIIKPRDDEGDADRAPSDFSDALYDQAIAIVCESRKASVSYIQRRLAIGYNRSARMVEQMERDGIVGPPNGMKEREVLSPPGDYAASP